jgi:hypothetical protein
MNRAAPSEISNPQSVSVAKKPLVLQSGSEDNSDGGLGCSENVSDPEISSDGKSLAS